MPIAAAPNLIGASGNFLIPNGTFIAELIGFLIIAGLLGVKVVPHVNAMLTQRQEAIRKTYEDAEASKSKLEAAEVEYRELIAAARADAAQQKEEAREQGAQIIAELRATGQAEAERIIKAARQQIEAERTRTVAALRAEIGTLAVELAGRVVGEALADDERQHRVVERFLTEVESRGDGGKGGGAGGADGTSGAVRAGAQVPS